jgi:hypothetical protein
MFGKRGSSGGGVTPPETAAPAPVAVADPKPSAGLAPPAEAGSPGRPDAAPAVPAGSPPAAAAPKRAETPATGPRPRGAVLEAGIRRSENFYDIK